MLQDISEQIDKADAFLIITPEYNHSVPPALTNLLDHFSPAQYHFKPSGIVSYSLVYHRHFNLN